MTITRMAETERVSRPSSSDDGSASKPVGEARAPAPLAAEEAATKTPHDEAAKSGAAEKADREAAPAVAKDDGSAAGATNEPDDPTDAGPDSRGPCLPPEPKGPARVVKPRGGKGGTVRMWGPAGDPAERASQGGRSTASSLTGQRKSRLSAVRETILSALPPIPKSIAALGGPIIAIVLVFGVALSAVVFLAATGRLPEGIARRLPFSEPKGEQGDVPAPPSQVIVIEEELDEVMPPSAKPGRTSVGRAVLQIPKTFTAMQDGGFDMVVHFNGNTELVLESYEVALLDTVVLVVNLGNGSGIYEEQYTNPEALNRVFDKVPKVLEARGLKDAHIRRVALSAWSAGYGAVVKSLAHPAHADRVDAVILLDGLHSSYKPGTSEVEGLLIEPVLKFAERARTGEKLLVITHSNIKPEGYLGVRETVDYLLGRMSLERHDAKASSSIPRLRAAKGVLPEEELRPLELRSEVRDGSFIVRGFGGDQPAHHISHLMQMSVLALPELAKRWAPAEKEAQ